MTQPPDFDPYELLGVDASADGPTVDRAYKARIRFVHPDIAGTAGLNETKRLNIAREWLLDSELRAKLPKPPPTWGARRRRPAPEPHETPQPQTPPGPWAPGEAPPPSWSSRPRGESQSWWDGVARPSWEYDPNRDDPLSFDYGALGERLQRFFAEIRGLSRDERARVTYSLGDEPPFFFDEFQDRLDRTLWNRSLALDDAVFKVWSEREEEDRPLLFPSGRVFGNGAVVANAYAQWILLSEAIARHSTDTVSYEALAARSTLPWVSSVGHPRYGTQQHEVVHFLRDARQLSLVQAERLSRSWTRHMGSYLYGRPGEDWFPGSLDRLDPDLVGARLAAVDASWVEPPDSLPFELRNGFRYGLRLTAHVIALGGPERAGKDYLAPWREALNVNPSFAARTRWGLPKG
jgi:hypothetical protein